FSAVHCIEYPAVIIFIKHCQGKTELPSHFMESIIFYNSCFLVMSFHLLVNLLDFFSVFLSQFSNFFQLLESCEKTLFKIFAIFPLHECCITPLEFSVTLIEQYIEYNKNRQHNKYNYK